MKRFIKPTYDASIYEGYPTINTGLDEILEVGKDSSERNVVRALLYFDLPDVSSEPADTEFYLNLYIADAKYVHRYSSIEAFPISTSWREGSGYVYQDVKNVSDGVSWETRDGTLSWSVPGGVFDTTVSASLTFDTIPFSSRLQIDITDIIRTVDSSTWNGIVVKFTDDAENDVTNVGNIKFFSSDTHTIFAPRIEIVRYDQTFTTGSLKPIGDTTINVVARNIKEAYTVGEQDKIYLVVRDKYPDKRFDATQRYRNQYYLPSESYYRIRDQLTDLEIFSFDAASAISCDPSGSYITLDTSGLDVNRYYDIELKVKTDSRVFFPEFKYTFKIDNDS
jgi:hypothetical protein